VNNIRRTFLTVLRHHRVSSIRQCRFFNNTAPLSLISDHVKWRYVRNKTTFSREVLNEFRAVDEKFPNVHWRIHCRCPLNRTNDFIFSYIHNRAKTFKPTSDRVLRSIRRRHNGLYRPSPRAPYEFTGLERVTGRGLGKTRDCRTIRSGQIGDRVENSGYVSVRRSSKSIIAREPLYSKPLRYARRTIPEVYPFRV